MHKGEHLQRCTKRIIALAYSEKLVLTEHFAQNAVFVVFNQQPQRSVNGLEQRIAGKRHLAGPGLCHYRGAGCRNDMGIGQIHGMGPAVMGLDCNVLLSTPPMAPPGRTSHYPVPDRKAGGEGRSGSVLEKK